MEAVYVDNYTKILRKIESYKDIDNSQIVVVSDFDKTLTYGNINSLMETLRTHKEIWPNEKVANSYFEKAWELVNKYYPIEIDPSISHDEKIKAMDEWWRKAYCVMIDHNFTKDMIYRALEIGLNSGKIILRDYVKDYLSMLKDNNIPLLILTSQGLGKIAIDYILNHNGIKYDNIYVIGNEIIFDNEGFMKGYNEPIITIANKHVIDLTQFNEIYDKIKERKYVILHGDVMEDIKMDEVIKDKKETLSFGFLPPNISDDKISIYVKHYDFVFPSKATFKHVKEIVEYIL